MPSLRPQKHTRMGDREGPGTGKGKKAQEPSRAMLAEAQPDEAVSATVRGSHAEGQRRVKLKARFECPVSDKGKGPARVEHPRDFAPTQPKKVLDAGQALPSGRTSKSRAVHGVSPADEDALARNMRKGQSIGQRTAAFLRLAQKAIRQFLCDDSHILQMTGPVSTSLRDAAGSAT